MAKNTKTDEPIFVVSTLIKAKDEVYQLLEKQIAAAEPILNMQVSLLQPYTGYNRSAQYNESEKESFFREYKNWNLMNREIFTRSFKEANNTSLNEYNQSGHFYPLNDIVNEQKKAMRDQVAYIESFLKRIDLIDCEVATRPNETTAITYSKKVFIVHGHDDKTRTEVENFVRSIGYEPVILCKRADMGDTIIEKIEREAKNVCYAIVIYTACDLGKDKNVETLSPRARQNVVFEHGYMCAKLTRKRVVALLESGVEQPGDLSGVIYKQLDSNGLWKFAIAKEMSAIGLQVDFNQIA